MNTVNTPKILIGIDPDLKKSGFAVWYKESKELFLLTHTFFGLLNEFTYYSDPFRRESVQVKIEAGWLNKKSNFRGGKNQSISDIISKKVGENHATGKLIAEMCEHLKLPYKLIKPTKAKTSPETFKKLTGIDCKNQEMIDAAMLVYGF